MDWFGKELQQLQDCPSVNLLIHVTRDDALSDNLSSSGFLTVAGEPEKGPTAVEDVVKGALVMADVEKGKEEVTGQATVSVSAIRKGRPDIAVLIADCLSQCVVRERVGVGACGPVNIIESTREVTCRSIFDSGPFITFHSEVIRIFQSFVSFWGDANTITGIWMVRMLVKQIAVQLVGQLKSKLMPRLRYLAFRSSSISVIL